MHIAVNTRYLLSDKMEGFGVYSHEILRRMVEKHPKTRYRFCFDRPFDKKYVYGPNVDVVSLWPPARHPLLYRIWYQFQLKRHLERHRPDVFFSPDSYMPLGMRIPTVLTVHDVAPRRYPDHITRSQRAYYLRNMPVFLDEAAHIITVSEFSRREIMRFYEVPEKKITVVHNGVAPHFKPVEPGIRQETLRRLTGGKPYFLYVGAIHPRKNVATLVQAFDIFKKMTNNAIQLVIAGERSWKTEAVSHAIDTSEHSSEIHQPGYLPEDQLPSVVGSAMAMCYVSLYEGFGMPVLEAMACGVPVLTSSTESTGAALAEVAGDAALQVDPMSAQDIAHGMKRIAEKAELRNRMSELGLERARAFSWDRTAEETYAILRRVATRKSAKL